MSFREQIVLNEVLTDANLGVPESGIKVVERGDMHRHFTVLTLSDIALPAIAGGAALAVGKLLYTLPAGDCIINAASMKLSITQSEGNINADTPDGGLGTVIASGAVSVLGGTTTFEDILTGQTFDDCNGTEERESAAPGLAINAADPHTIHFNVADLWAASGDAAAKLNGTVVIDWSFLQA